MMQRLSNAWKRRQQSYMLSLTNKILITYFVRTAVRKTPKERHHQKRIDDARRNVWWRQHGPDHTEVVRLSRCADEEDGVEERDDEAEAEHEAAHLSTTEQVVCSATKFTFTTKCTRIKMCSASKRNVISLCAVFYLYASEIGLLQIKRIYNIIYS